MLRWGDSLTTLADSSSSRRWGPSLYTNSLALSKSGPMRKVRAALPVGQNKTTKPRGARTWCRSKRGCARIRTGSLPRWVGVGVGGGRRCRGGRANHPNALALISNVRCRPLGLQVHYPQSFNVGIGWRGPATRSIYNVVKATLSPHPTRQQWGLLHCCLLYRL